MKDRLNNYVTIRTVMFAVAFAIIIAVLIRFSHNTNWKNAQRPEDRPEIEKISKDYTPDPALPVDENGKNPTTLESAGHFKNGEGPVSSDMDPKKTMDKVEEGKIVPENKPLMPADTVTPAPADQTEPVQPDVAPAEPATPVDSGASSAPVQLKAKRLLAQVIPNTGTATYPQGGGPSTTGSSTTSSSIYTAIPEGQIPNSQTPGEASTTPVTAEFPIYYDQNGGVVAPYGAQSINPNAQTDQQMNNNVQTAQPVQQQQQLPNSFNNPAGNNPNVNSNNQQQPVQNRVIPSSQSPGTTIVTPQTPNNTNVNQGRTNGTTTPTGSGVTNPNGTIRQPGMTPPGGGSPTP